MLRYLWENFGQLYWDLSNFKCLMKQLINQKWLEAINFIFRSEVTQQMVKCLNSQERSCFVEQYIGHPFSKNFDYNTRECLLNNLCAEPYAGSLLVLLIEYFDELHSIQRKTKKEGQEIIVALAQTTAEAEVEFKRWWKQVLMGLYPMEIQVLKETCRDRFNNFLASLEALPLKSTQPLI